MSVSIHMHHMINMQRQVCVVSLLLLSSVALGQQLLQNPGFEQELTADDWFCQGNCDLTQDPDSHTGLFSGRVTNREQEWNVVSQYVSLSPNSTYYFECWVKMLNLVEGSLYQEGQLRIHMEYQTSSQHMAIAFQPHMRPELGWQLLSGDFFTGPEEIVSARIYTRFLEPEINYLVDTTSLVKLIPDENWKAEANLRIENVRKSDVTLNVQIGEAYDPTLISIQVNQGRHHFAFGTATREDQLIGTDEDSQKYRQCFFDNFEWSVFVNAHKWRQMEPNKDDLRFPDEAVQVLYENGYPMRGHCLFWNRPDRNPDWSVDLPGEELLQEMVRRINYTVPRYSHAVVHWDVNNEQLHGDFYENKTGNVDIMTTIFNEVRKYDEDALLFINDFAVVRSSSYTRALANSALHLLSQGAPVGGIGVQSHLSGPITLDMITAMQKRLEVVGSVGLPVWITELDVTGMEDPMEKADAYDNVMTLYFSDPNIDGVSLWGFSEIHHPSPDAALFEGPDYTPNESGLRWQEMLFDRWHTSATFMPESDQESFGLRGFQGQYFIQVMYEDAIIQEQEFYLEKEDITVDVTID